MIVHGERGQGIESLLNNKKLEDKERKNILIVSEALSLIYYEVEHNTETTLLKEMEHLEKYVELLHKVLK